MKIEEAVKIVLKEIPNLDNGVLAKLNHFSANQMQKRKESVIKSEGGILVTKLTDVKNDWKWYEKKPIHVKVTELVEEIRVETREGVVKGYPGDFLIQGVEGEIYPCGKEIFWKTYKLYFGGKSTVFK